MDALVCAHEQLVARESGRSGSVGPSVCVLETSARLGSHGDHLSIAQQLVRREAREMVVVVAVAPNVAGTQGRRTGVTDVQVACANVGDSHIEAQ